MTQMIKRLATIATMLAFVASVAGPTTVEVATPIFEASAMMPVLKEAMKFVDPEAIKRLAEPEAADRSAAPKAWR